MLFQAAPGAKETHKFLSLIVEIRPGGKYFYMNIKHDVQMVQRVQFIYNRKPNFFYLLFFFGKQFVQLYQIPVRHKQKNIVEISAHPNLLKTVVNHFQWFEWDRQHNTLYVLQKMKQGSHSDFKDSPLRASNGADSKVARCVLKCLHIPDRIYEELWEIPLKVSFVDELTEFCGRSKLYYGVDRRAKDPECRFFTMVKLNGVSILLDLNYFDFQN